MPPLPANPSVSVVMPVRNGAATVVPAADDLLDAMASDDELLIIDDGSSDQTPVLLRTAAERDPRVRIITTGGGGLVEALNLGVREAQHAWIARADCDDRYPADRLAHQRQAIGAGVVLVTGDYAMRVGGSRAGVLPCALTHPFVVTSLIHPQRIPHPGVMVSKDAVMSVGGYRRDEHPAEDLGLWLRLATTGAFVGVPHTVVEWHLSAGSVTHAQQASQRAKVNDLLARPFPREVLQGLNPDAVVAELAAYRDTEWQSERRVLLMRDLRAWARRGIGSDAYERSRAEVLRDLPASARAAVRLGSDRSKRRRLRRSLTTSAATGAGDQA